MSSGYALGTSTTADFRVNRTRLIEMAHEVLGVREEGRPLTGQEIQQGRDFLGMILRETDESGKWRWTIGTSVSLPLQSKVAVYKVTNGLPTNMAELVSASYRNAEGHDVELTLLQAEGYERIAEKAAYGEPQAVYLDSHVDLGSRTLRVWPHLKTVTAQSVIVGSDNNPYQCVMPHTAEASNQPISGSNWSMYWEQGGASVTAWASGTAYTTAEQIRLLYRRPIADLDESGHYPDFPLAWPRVILYKLAFDLGECYGLPIPKVNQMIEKAKGAYSDIFPNMRAHSTDLHNKVRFF